ncbi:MAG: MBL fold metallo-hydrolase [Lachnospiraceae bacterium]|nr:MBL fold metallo-hydrolase [Lachnospiraceae bacterium]
MAEIKIGRMTLGVCATNCYFLYKEGNSDVIMIDPADRGADIYNALKGKGMNVAAILLTHAHFDHIYGADKLRELSGAKIYALDAEKVVCQDAYVNVSAQFGRKVTIAPDEWLTDGQKLTLADVELEVISTPGHTIGSVCYYVKDAGILVAGDTLFENSVGRTDFPTGSMSKLVRSIKEKLFVLPDETKVYPGHGDSTTIGNEKKYNPFCQ